MVTINKPIVTRFAPSPTGFLHIGAVRTALFAYLFARAHHGKFILRIEDTDQTRYVEGAEQNIEESLKWLGIHWDEGPIRQSERKPLYQQYADQLLGEGRAYYCFCSKERLDQLREQQQRDKLRIGYDGHCRGVALEGVRARVKAGESAVVRFKIPDLGQTRFVDAIRGEVVFNNQELDDLILLKSDGFPTYHLAHVVDDHLMGVTHVHRGEEWIPSTPKHILMFQALDWAPPEYVHLPVILSQGGGKLSKRKGSVFVTEFKEKGYLPEAMINFMVLLGWGYSETEEMYSLSELEKIFSHEHINKASPVFSFEKLDWFNGVYIRKKTPRELAELCRPYLQQAGLDGDDDYLLRVIGLLQERIHFLPDLVEKGRFFYVDEVVFENEADLIPKNATQEESLRYLRLAKSALENLADFSIEAIDACLRGVADQNHIKAGQLFMPIRVAVSGSKASPGLFEMLAVLGKERVLKRLRAAESLLQARG